MTMHLTHHTTTGKRRAKFKYASAEHKRQSLELEQEWETLKQRHSTNTESTNKSNIPMKKYKLEIPEWRKTINHPSLNTGVGTAVKKDVPQYTGNNVVGISIMHKSCLQPVFNQQEAIDAANMRRG
jgi:hypothetical protein